MTHEAGIGVAPATLSIHIQGEERDLGTRVIHTLFFGFLPCVCLNQLYKNKFTHVKNPTDEGAYGKRI